MAVRAAIAGLKKAEAIWELSWTRDVEASKEARIRVLGEGPNVF